MTKSERMRLARQSCPTAFAYFAYVDGYESLEPVGESTGSRFPTAGGQELHYWRRQGWQDAENDRA